MYTRYIHNQSSVWWDRFDLLSVGFCGCYFRVIKGIPIPWMSRGRSFLSETSQVKFANVCAFSNIFSIIHLVLIGWTYTVRIRWSLVSHGIIQIMPVSTKEHHHLLPEYCEILLLHGSNLVAIGDPYLTHIFVGIIGLKQAINMNILFRPNFLIASGFTWVTNRSFAFFILPP